MEQARLKSDEQAECLAVPRSIGPFIEQMQQDRVHRGPP
jgi:hypothetical protein